MPDFAYGDTAKISDGIIPTKASEIYTLIRILIILKRPKTNPRMRLIPINKKRRETSPAIFFGKTNEEKKSKKDAIKIVHINIKLFQCTSHYAPCQNKKDLYLHKKLLFGVYYLYP